MNLLFGVSLVVIRAPVLLMLIPVGTGALILQFAVFVKSVPTPAAFVNVAVYL
ncbi:hypothetical protein D3C77_640610 [compost metagenome]